ncbi:MAG TPA: FAD-dependent oxidoreductase [Solirubrobacteraceae bacterium]|jgi:sulfide:quinone oxidoreductase|nr:FAD-dependent oxidoreductase [Solirubrobacteraceae bacterium]
MSTIREDAPFKVLIAGGGVAGIEGALALRELAGDRVSIEMLAPEPEFVYRPMTVREPFAYGRAQRYSLGEMAGEIGVDLSKKSFAWVNSGARVAYTDGGEELSYDALLLALGARIHPRYTHAYTIDDSQLDDILHGLLQDVEGGYVKRLAFVIPVRMAWQLPVYELALMTAGRAYEMDVRLSITIVTPEESPLAIFGSGASQAVSKLLEDAGIEVLGSAYAEVPQWDTVVVNPDDRRLEFDRVVALPELYGPGVRGLPSAEHGFIPCDVHAKVRGVERVYAAGDATDFALKHGGIACQQADAAAEAIAALAGVEIDPQPFNPTVYGMLLTGGAPRYLRAHITGGHGFSSEVSEQPLWTPPRKIVARYLAPFLERFEAKCA